MSIVIPTFNRLELFQDAVVSCLAQSYRNIEVVVVDDGSTDGTSTFVANALHNEWRDRVRYIPQKNLGASAARNLGARVALGKYLQFLDSDDLLIDTKIAEQVSALERNGSTQEVCSCFGRLEQIGAVGLSRRIGIKRSTPLEYVRGMCGPASHGMPTCAPLWNRALLLSQPGWNHVISLGDDLEYFVRLLLKVRSVDFVEKELFLVREHRGSRLSDVGGSALPVRSASLAIREIVKSTSDACVLNGELSTSLYARARTAYVNLLSYGAEADLKDFEDWYLGVGELPVARADLRLAIAVRRLIGARLVAAFAAGLIRLRRFFGGG